MIASQIARSFTKLALNSQNSNFKLYGLVYRNASSQSKTNIFRRSVRSRLGQTTSETITEIPSLTPLKIGHGLLAGASVIGLGSLAYYGLGFSNKEGILERSALWPKHIRERISTTYGYFGASLGVTALSALAVARSPALLNFAASSRWPFILGSFAAIIGSGMLVRSIPYEPNKIGSKQLAWILHSGLLGAFVSPITLLGGPILVKAAWYTAGVIAGLSVIAATAPNEKFLNMAGPLGIGMGVVFAASLGGMFFPPTTRLGLSLYSISIYGGLVLFSMFLLYDTQKICHKAENSFYYDPINESISIYLDTLNIFIRIAQVLAGGNRRK